MLNLTLIRDTNGPDGCFGVLTNPATGHTWQTAELECQNNQPDISSIPPVNGDDGNITYLVEMQPHPLHGSLGEAIGFPGMCYEIMDVVDRFNILMHIVNYAGQVADGERTDVLGCMGLGTDRGKMLPPGYNQPQEVIEHSTQAILDFYKEMGGQPFYLSIQNKF